LEEEEDNHQKTNTDDGMCTRASEKEKQKQCEKRAEKKQANIVN